MPVYFSKTIGTGQKVLIWQLDETLNELIEAINPDQVLLDELNEISVDSKKREFLAGRYVLEKACKFLGFTFKGMEKDEYGKPHMVGREYEISLTHTEDFIGVVFSETPVGIDLETPREQIFRILPRLFSEKEVSAVGGRLDKATVYWSAKEALYKLYGKRGVDFKKDLILSEEEGSLSGRICLDNYDEIHRIYMDRVGPYILVVAY